MGFLIESKCNACGYGTAGMTIGDAKHVVCICHSCRSLVNPARVPFRYEINPCPKCSAELQLLSQIDVLNIKCHREFKLASNITCPRCDDGRMCFRDIMHFSLAVNNRIPAHNKLVHGVLDQGKLTVPTMWFRGRSIVSGLPNDSEGRKMELLVKKIDLENVTDPSIEFGFVRFLTPQE